jgi:hypothetical protein
MSPSPRIKKRIVKSNEGRVKKREETNKQEKKSKGNSTYQRTPTTHNTILFGQTTPTRLSPPAQIECRILIAIREMLLFRLSLYLVLYLPFFLDFTQR